MLIVNKLFQNLKESFKPKSPTAKKASSVSKSSGLRDVNHYRWILLTVFGKPWAAGDGRDQIIGCEREKVRGGFLSKLKLLCGTY